MSPLDGDRDAGVVRIRTELPGSGDYRFGSGYLIADQLVLTAEHVLRPHSGTPAAPGQPAQVITAAALLSGDDDWQQAYLAWSDARRDVAVLVAAGLRPDHVTRWGQLPPARAVRWRAVGYPRASGSESGRQPAAVGGTADRGPRTDHVLPLGVSPRQPATTSGWKGMSGAAVFCDELLAGVVISVPDNWDNSLEACWVGAFAADPALARVLGGIPRLEPIGQPPETSTVPVGSGEKGPATQAGEGRDRTGLSESGDQRREPPQLAQPSQPPAEPPPQASLVRTPQRQAVFLARLRPIVDRREQLREVTELLGGNRLITLCGPPGVGKSRLSAEIAASARPVYQGRVWGVPLDELPSGSGRALVAQHLEPFVGADPNPAASDPLEALRRVLGDGPGLLILDNCEHVTEVAAEIVTLLLAAADELRVLATSQQPLGVPDELDIRVEPLSPADAAALFADVAWTGRGEPAPRPDVAIGEICARLGYLPDPVRVAASLVRSGVDIGEVRAGVASNALPAVQRAVAESYQHLSAEQQRMLRLTSLFSAPFRQDDAVMIYGQDDESPDPRPEAVLRALHRRALLELTDSRFSTLESTRQYAGQKLRLSGEEPAARDRFARYFLGRAEAEAARKHGPGELDGLRWMDENLTHLGTALRILSERAPDAELHARLAIALENFWRLRGYLREGTEQLRAVLAASQVQGRLRAEALMAAARLADRQGGAAEAHSQLDEAVRIATGLDDVALEAAALLARGYLRYEYGQEDHGDLERAREMAHRAGLRSLEQNALNSLGLVARRQGDLTEAMRCYERSLALAQELGDVLAQGAVQSNMGLVWQDEGDYPRARQAFEAALASHEAAGEAYAVAVIRLNLARNALAEAKYAEAETWLTAGLAEADRIGARGVEAWAYDLMGWLAEARAADSDPVLTADEHRDALTAALQQYVRATELHGELQDAWRAGLTAESAGDVAHALADEEAAGMYYQRAAGWFRAAGHEEDAQRADDAARGGAGPEPGPDDLADLLSPVSAELARFAEMLAPGETPPDPGQVTAAFRAAMVFALGHSSDDGAASDLLHFQIDAADGTERTCLPVFTGPEPMRDALLRNPDWQELSVLELNGGALLDNVDDDVQVVINPWDDSEFIFAERSSSPR